MFDVCPACGLYSVEKEIDPSGPFAICPDCGHKQPFLRLPLFIVTGPSGAGKSTTCLALLGKLPECVTLECDILWRPEFDTPSDNYAGYRDTWLRMAMNINQSGRPAVLFCSGVPDQYENRPGRRYFSAIDYLALVCDDDLLVERLKSRPAWRKSASEAFIENMLRYNRWLKENAANTQPPISLLDTGKESVEQSAEGIIKWVRSLL